jgi:hypothetical protein
MDALVYTFVASVPTDPQVLAVYNGLSRAQRARYATITTDRGRSDYLYGVAEEKKKPVCLLR